MVKPLSSPSSRRRAASGSSSSLLPLFFAKNQLALGLLLLSIVSLRFILPRPDEDRRASLLVGNEVAGQQILRTTAAKKLISTKVSENEGIATQNDDAADHPTGLSIQQETLDHLMSLPRFPRTVHLTWSSSQVLDGDYEILNHGAKQLKTMNPNWKFIVHDNDDIDQTIQKFDGISNSVREVLLEAHIVEKTDAFRLIKIFQEGGLYVDMDRVMNKNLDKVIDTETTKLVVPTYYDINFAQDLFGSSPGNELILNVLKAQNEKRLKFPRTKSGWLKSSDHMILTYEHSRSLEKDLFGKTLQSDNNAVWNETRHLLDKHSRKTIITYRDVWCDGLLVDEFEGCKAVSRESLYQAYNVKPWAEEVDKAFQMESISY